MLAPRVVPHFDNHSLADRPMFMDDNACRHRARIVQHLLQQEVVQTFPWPAMSPDMYGTLLAEKLTNTIQNVNILTN